MTRDDDTNSADPRAKVTVHPKVASVLRRFEKDDATTIQRLRHREAQNFDDGADDLFDNLPV